MIELNACDIDPISNFADGDLNIVGEILKNMPAEQIVIDSDYGQNGNIKPVEGLLHFAEFLAEKYGLIKILFIKSALSTGMAFRIKQ